MRIIHALAVLPLIGAAPATTIELEVSGLRAERGQVLVCLVRDKSAFPDCSDHPAAARATQRAENGAVISFANLPSGTYAAAMIHDENGNGRLDTRLGIPREGVGFSRNPRFMFGPPSFKSATFPADRPQVEQTIRMRYFL